MVEGGGKRKRSTKKYLKEGQETMLGKGLKALFKIVVTRDDQLKH